MSYSNANSDHAISAGVYVETPGHCDLGSKFVCSAEGHDLDAGSIVSYVKPTSLPC